LNLHDFAEKELRLVGLFDQDSDYSGKLAEGVMELIKVFNEQGHSGMSASMTIQLLSRLLSYKPLTPLTGEDNEWFDHGEGLYQNVRCPSVFKNAERAWDVNTDKVITFPYVVE